jgi:hypothetical protein
VKYFNIQDVSFLHKHWFGCLIVAIDPVAALSIWRNTCE